MSIYAQLKARLSQDDILVVPGVFDSLSALLAQQAGFEAVFLSGSAVSYSQLGRPDMGLVTMSEMVDSCARITDRVDIPVFVDIDSGFGNAVHAGRTIRALEKAGAAAVQVEDQLSVNPVSDLKGRPLVSAQVMADKIKAMADDRQTDILISARSDSPFSESFDKVLERVSLYRDAGADMIFVEGLKQADQVSDVVKEAGGLPVVYNLLRPSEMMSASQLETLGVSLALFPGALILPSVAAMRSSLAALKDNRSLSPDGHPIALAKLGELLGTPEILARFDGYSE